MTEESGTDSGDDKVDLEAYLARVGYSGALDPTLETLEGLHLAHALNIPFENLDVLLGRPIALDLPSLQAKLVTGRRGGYCFEQNGLFAAVLESLGFSVIRLAARVRLGTTKIRPRTHMLILATIDGEFWLADVGFGGGGLLQPLRMRFGETATQFAWSFRLASDGDLYILQSRAADGWLDLYAFSLEPQHPVDYVVANYFTSTHPRSPFTTNLLAQRAGREESWLLLNRQLTQHRPGHQSVSTLPDDDALLDALAEHFGLRFPEGTRFHYAKDRTVFEE